MKRNIRNMTLGAMIAALIVITVLLDRITVGMFQVFIPLPLIIYGSRTSSRECFLTYTVSVLLVFITMGSIPYTILAMMYGLLGFTYVLIRKQTNNKVLHLFAVFVMNCVNYGIMMTFFAPIFGIEYAETMHMIQSFLNIKDEILANVLSFAWIAVVALMESYVIILVATTVQPLLKRMEK